MALLFMVEMSVFVGVWGCVCVCVCVCGPAYHYWAAINECWALDSNDYRLLIAELAGAL